MKLEVEYRLYEHDGKAMNTAMVTKTEEFWIKPESDVKIDNIAIIMAEASQAISSMIEAAIPKINKRFHHWAKMERRIGKL